MLQKTHSLVLYKLINHVMQYSSYSVKTFVGLANIVLEQYDEPFFFLSPYASLTNPVSSKRIFWTTNIATVLDNSLPVSMMRRQRGMISVDKRKLITSGLSFCSSHVSWVALTAVNTPGLPWPKLQWRPNLSISDIQKVEFCLLYSKMGKGREECELDAV